MDCSTLGLPVHHQLPEFTQTHVHWVGDTIQPSHPLSSPSLPAFNLCQHQGLFKWVLRLRWPKYWSFSFSISPSNEYSGLISFRMDWFDLLAVISSTAVQKHQFLGIQPNPLSLVLHSGTPKFGKLSFASKQMQSLFLCSLILTQGPLVWALA